VNLVIKTIIRNFRRNPVTNVINLLGLSVSLTLVIILSVYCYSELTTDNYQKNRDQVYLYLPAADQAYTPGVLKQNIDMKVPAAASCIRIGGTWETPVFQAEGRDPVTSDLLYSDEDFFNFFSYNVLAGDPGSALKEPMTVIITEGLSHKLFGDEMAIGKIIKLNNNRDLTVRAVIEEPESNTCLSFSAVTSISTQKIIQGEGGEYTEWGWCDFQTFILLNKNSDPGKTAQDIFGVFPTEFRDSYKNARLLPLNEIYFSKITLFGSEYIKTGDRKKVMLLVLVGFMVLIIALINFINISSSQWLERIKQTGVLKVFGARQLSISLNILGESFLFFLVSLIIAVEMVDVLNPVITAYTGIHYSSKLIYSPIFIIFSLAGILLLSLTLSIIPAMRISSSNIVDNLKNTTKPEKRNYSISGLLVTVQFGIAIVLIAFTLLIQKQIRFGSNNLGINQDNIIGIKLTEQLGQKREVLKKMLLEQPGMNSITYTQFFPGNVISYWGVESITGGEKRHLNFDTFSADGGFLEMMGFKLVSGRFYDEKLTSDKGKVVVNETFIREHDIIQPDGFKFTTGKREFEIVGVMKDFHFKSVTQPITSLAIRNEGFASWCLVSLQSLDFSVLQNSVQAIEKIVSELSPSFPVEIKFFDQAIENMYQSELQFRKTYSLFAGCAVIIACLGILAISLFASQRRIKEIGIRKVNGAKICELLVMLNKDFVKCVGIAFIIASPVAWYVMHKWLENFAYKTEISWWIFALAGLFALSFALLTVSWQSWRAATRNPVEALRYE